MDEIKKKIIEEVKALCDEGSKMQLEFIASQIVKEQASKPRASFGKVTKTGPASTPKETPAPRPSVESRYQAWYSKALRVIQQLMPDRYDEFRQLYRYDRPPKDNDATTYAISDYLLGTRMTYAATGAELFDHAAIFYQKFKQQCEILASAMARVESLLNNIEGLLQAHLFDRELSAATDLLEKGYVRPAGVLAGVTLEAHLAKVAENHGLKFRKANPTIFDFNEALRTANVMDVPVWRHIQLLGDIRNLSAHPKEREPKPDEVEDLIRGTEKIVATLF